MMYGATGSEGGSQGKTQRYDANTRQNETMFR
jgi:hypothetical protein